jgi:tetratricopeptide (TPR) repeat protein
VLLERGELDEAEHELQTVLRSATENLAAIRGLAEIYHARGALGEALVYYKAALALARNDPDLDETVADLSKRLDPQRRPDPENGLSFAQMEQELAVQAGPPPVAPPVAPQPAPPLVEPIQEADPQLEAAERAAHVVTALEQWLTAIAANHVARTQPPT